MASAAGRVFGRPASDFNSGHGKNTRDLAMLAGNAPTLMPGFGIRNDHELIGP